jgi:regulatory protein
MTEVKKKTFWTPDVAREHMMRYCAAQERSHAEVRTKLIEHGIYGDDLDEILTMLIAENFLDEGRFAAAYVSGKYRMNHWGRNKIIQGLKAKFVSKYCIDEGLKVIDEEEYIDILKDEFSKKLRQLGGKRNRIIDQKLIQFLMQKGFEYELISNILKEPM